jgi:hypothetical protein
MDTHLSPPLDLRGRRHPDRLFSVLGVIISSYE